MPSDSLNNDKPTKGSPGEDKPRAGKSSRRSRRRRGRKRRGEQAERSAATESGGEGRAPAAPVSSKDGAKREKKRSDRGRGGRRGRRGTQAEAEQRGKAEPRQNTSVESGQKGQSKRNERGRRRSSDRQPGSDPSQVAPGTAGGRSEARARPASKSQGEDVRRLRWSQPPPSMPPPSESLRPEPMVVLQRGPVEPVFLAPSEPEEGEPDEETLVDLTPFEAEFDQPDHEGTLRNVVLVRALRSGKVKRVDAGDEVYRPGEVVLTEKERGGPELVVVLEGNERRVERGRMGKIVRRLGQEDEQTQQWLRKREEEVLAIAKHVARSLDMPIKIVRAQAESSKKTTVYFASEQRVDMRDFFRRVAAAAQGKVELRQVGVRDAARMIGGVGLCGQPLCCSTFLREFAPVSIRMAKDQGLVLSPTRVSGLCGRLLCCLTYEEALYRKQRKLLPRIGKRVYTPLGPGKVRDVDVLRQVVRVALESGNIAAFEPSEVTPMFPSGGTQANQDGSKNKQKSSGGKGQGGRRSKAKAGGDGRRDADQAGGGQGERSAESQKEGARSGDPSQSSSATDEGNSGGTKGGMDNG